MLEIESGEAVEAARTHKPRRNSGRACFSITLKGLVAFLCETHAVAKKMPKIRYEILRRLVIRAE